MKFYMWGFIIFVSFLFLSCNNDSSENKKNTNLNVSNTSLRNKLELRGSIVLDESSFKIGEILSTTTYVDEDNGEIYINDAKNHIFVCFNKTGKFKQLLGKKGRGPGEFVYPGPLTMDEEHNIYVFDMKKFCTIIYNVKKQFLREVTYPGLFPDTGRLYAKNGYKIICLMAPTDNSSYYSNISTFHILDDNFHIKQSLIIDFPDIYEMFNLTTYTSIEYVIGSKYVYVHYPALPAVYQYNLKGQLNEILHVNTNHFKAVDSEFSDESSTLETVKKMSQFSYGMFLFLFNEKYLFFGYVNEDLPDDSSFDIRAGKKYSKYYYNIITTEGEQVFTENSLLPGEPLYCTPGGELYILLNDEPENRKIGVYEIVLEDI